MFCGLQSNRCRKRCSRNCAGEVSVAHMFSKGFSASKMNPSNLSKMKVETRSGMLWRLPHEFALCSYNFGLLSGSLLCFIVWNPIRKKKTLNPTNVRFRLKDTRIAIILNPPAGPLRRFDLLQTFRLASNYTSSFYSGLVKRRME